MADIQRLLEIAQDLELREFVDKLTLLQERRQETNTKLIIPLVGEFSAGKTSILNALTSGKKLETAAAPTTEVIFELYFSQPEEKAIVYQPDGSFYEKSVDELKNSSLEGACLVKVFDASTRVPGSTVLVDTPGLSSPNAKHKETLIAYLPHADIILMTVDINQGVTASMLKFIEVAELAKRRIYMVITKCDEKPPAEQQAMRGYIKNNTKLPIERIICVSARDGKMDELIDLIAAIQEDKDKIVAEVIGQQIALAGRELSERVSALLASSKLSTPDLDRQIAETARMNQHTRSRINRLIGDLSRSVENVADDTIRQFNRRISASLESFGANPPQGDINELAKQSVNNVATALFINFKTSIQKELRRLCIERRNSDAAVSLPLLNEIEQLCGTWQHLPFNIDLSLPNVQLLNKTIAGGAKVLAALGTAAVVICTAGAAAPVVAAAGGSAAAVGTAIKVADTATDVASMISNQKTLKKINELSTVMQSGHRAVGPVDAQTGQAAGPLISGKKNQGFLEGLVSSITEHTHAKPQRQKLISDYITNQLQPEFRQRMLAMGEDIIAAIENTLLSESDQKCAALADSLSRLKDERESQKAEFQQKIARLESYKNTLAAALPAGTETRNYLPLQAR